MPTPSTPLPSLPTDADALRTLLLASWAERDSLAAERDDLATQNDRLRHLLLQLKRLQFGTRSERLPEEQLQLGLEAVEQAIARDQAEAEHRDSDLKREHRAKRRANRGALPAHLPRIEVTLAPEDTACPCCRAAMTVIGEDSSERLDVIPAQFRVIVTRRPKFACRACAGTVVQLPAPARLIEGGIPTEALVAHVLVSRYADHLPLYRQAQIMARQGVALDRSTLAFWTGYAKALLGDYRGILQCDGYQAYKTLADPGGAPRALAFCWSHVRRGFYDLAKAGTAPIASEALLAWNSTAVDNRRLTPNLEAVPRESRKWLTWRGWGLLRFRGCCPAHRARVRK